MKKTILSFMLFAAAAITACGSKEKLTDEIEGTWTSTPQRIEVTSQYEADVVKVYELLPDGQAVISAMISTEKPLPDTSTLVEPVSLNAAATATMSGTYTVVSDSEIRITLDPKSLKVNVDPKAVRFMYDRLTSQEAPEVTALSATYARQLTDELTPVISADFFGAATLSGIKINGDKMTCRIDGSSVTLYKQV